MIAKIRTAGASDVIQLGATWREADAYLREVMLPNDRNGIYVPPFDHQDIWEGNSTIVEELSNQLNGCKPDALVCSVGGGGLFSGVMVGLDRCGWGNVNVLATETEGAKSLHASLQAGELITLPAITSIATSLGASRVAEKAFHFAQRPSVKSVTLSDAEACMGCWRLADDERLLVEPACGVSVAPCYDGCLKKLLPDLTPESRVVVVVCGGSNVTLEMLVEFRAKYSSVKQITTKDPDVPSTLAMSQ